MSSDTRVSLRVAWLVVLCALAVSCSLAAPLTTESPISLLALGAPGSRDADSELADWTETFEQDDSAMPAQMGLARLHLVLSLLNVSDPDEWTWSPPAPLHPPSMSN